MKPLDTKTARVDVETTFKLAFSYRDSDAAQAIITYLNARIAYYQAALVDADNDKTASMQQKARTLRDLRDALTAQDGSPRTII